MSANEELQSTNEELQSVNEELYTVNSEYQEKITQLTELNDDLDSVIDATNIGIVFLDESLSIRKFTSVAKQYIHLMENDVGRPLHHISHDLKYHDLISDVVSVSTNGETIERAVYTRTESAVLVRILPYRNSGGRISRGIVITLTNISRQRFVEAALERAQSQLRDVVLEGGAQLLIDHDQSELSVLLLEDDEVDQLRIQRMLTDIGDRTYNIQTFGQIDEAVKAVSSSEFDVCLLDYRLPGGTAKDFLDQASEYVQNTPCVLMSGYSEDDVDPSFVESGVFDFLNKDELTTQLIVRSIDYAIERRRVQASIEELSVSSDT